MSLITEIEKLKGRHFLFGLVAFLGSIGPGFLIIFHYHPELVEKYDIGKLLLFASALTLPFLFANVLSYAMLSDSTEEQPRVESGMVFGAFFNTFVLNGALGLAYVRKMNFLQMIGFAFAITAFAFVVAFIVSSKNRKLTKIPETNAGPEV